MWISVAMFALPEILFFTTPALLMSILGKSFTEISSLLVSYKFFLSYPLFLLFITAVEWVGVMGLLILSIKFNKKVFAILSGILLLWLFFVFGLVYIAGFSINF